MRIGGIGLFIYTGLPHTFTGKKALSEGRLATKGVRHLHMWALSLTWVQHEVAESCFGTMYIN